MADTPAACPASLELADRLLRHGSTDFERGCRARRGGIQHVQRALAGQYVEVIEQSSRAIHRLGPNPRLPADDIVRLESRHELAERCDEPILAQRAPQLPESGAPVPARQAPETWERQRLGQVPRG